MRRQSRELLQDRNNNVRVLDDENKQILLLNTFDLTPPEVGIFDAPYKCYQVNDEWAKIIMGFVSWLATPSPWAGVLVDDDNEGIQGILQFLSQTGLCMTYELRQNEENPCLLEQSVDGGETWTTAFNYSLCSPQQTIDMQEAENLYEEFAQLIDDYDGSIASLAPDGVYGVSTEQDERIDKAICILTYLWVTGMISTEKWKRAGWATIVNPVAGWFSLATGVITILTGGTIWLVGGLLVALAGVGYTIFASLSDALLNDDEAILNVACYWKDQIIGGNMTETNWREAFIGHPFAPLSNEAQIIGMYAPYLENDAKWEHWLGAIQKVLDLMDSYGWECPCIEVVCSRWNRLQNPYPSNFSFIAGTYYGWSDDWWSQTSGNNAMAHGRYTAPSPMNFVSTHMWGESSVLNTGSNISKFIIELRYQGAIVALVESPPVFGNGLSRDYEIAYDGLVDQIDYYALVWTSPATNSGSMRIEEIEIVVKDNGHVPTGEVACV